MIVFDQAIINSFDFSQPSTPSQLLNHSTVINWPAVARPSGFSSIHRASRGRSPFNVSLRMLRSPILRAPSSTSCFAPVRASYRTLRAPVIYGNIRCQHEQTRKAHAISNPTLANIESRWDTMPPQEQADLWMALRDRMKNDWNELTMQEKKAGMYNRNVFHSITGSTLSRLCSLFTRY